MPDLLHYPEFPVFFFDKVMYCLPICIKNNRNVFIAAANLNACQGFLNKNKSRHGWEMQSQLA